MCDNSFKSLYFATSFENLREKSEVNLNNYTTDRYFQLMAMLRKKATDARYNNDQELEFYFLHRYLLFVTNAKKKANISKKDKYWNKEFQNALNIEKRYTELTNLLKRRYQEQSAEPITILKDVSPGVTIIPNRVEQEEEIGSYKLRKLLTAEPPKETFLIMDVRPSTDFKASHIKHENVLNVASEKLDPGMSANTLSKIFVDENSINLWKMRGNVDNLILLDWKSSLETLQVGAPLNQLKHILLKWDQRVSYKSHPMILQGGYTDFLCRYPQITTDPEVLIPTEDNSINSNNLMSCDYPMEELEPEKKSTPKASVTQQLIVDRSCKPQLNQKDERNDSFTKNSSSILDKGANGDSSHLDSSLFNSIERPSINKVINDDEGVNKKQDLIEPTNISQNDSDSSYKNDNSIKIDDGKHEGIIEEPNSNKLSSTTSDWSIGSNNSRSDHLQELNELRKHKPHLSSSSQTSSTDNLKKRSDELWDSDEVTYSPLKSDGGSGGLKKSSSSPNIAQMKDDESLHVKYPSFTRANKPNHTFRHRTYGERTDSTYGTTSAGLTGLKNFANNCYMNSILQCLNNTEQLVKEMTALSKHTLNNNSRTRGRLAEEVIDAFRNMWSGEIRVYSIKDLKAIMGNIKDIFKGTAHQDSNEFLIILLEHLHEDLNKPKKVVTILDGAIVESGERAWGEFRRNNCSVIQRLFYGQHKSTVTCSTCSHKSATFEQFFNLFVPIPSSQSLVTLIDCIQLYMSGERINGWKCPKCNLERSATKKIDISRLPPILVIALKRFTHEDDSWLQKKEDIVQYPLENLDMSKFTVEGSEQRYTRYNLYAMSIHSGTLKSGHYRAICKNYKNEKWYLFDDQTVEPLPLQRVKNNPEVYILFYNAVTN